MSLNSAAITVEREPVAIDFDQSPITISREVGAAFEVEICDGEGADATWRTVLFAPTVMDVDTDSAVETVTIEPVVRAVIGDVLFPAAPSESPTSIHLTGETVSALQTVVVIDGVLFKADCTNPDHAGRVAGITVSAGTAGTQVTVRSFGRMSDPVWNWTAPQLFVGPGGTLVQSPPVALFVQSIARVESPDTVFVSVGPIFEQE